MLCRQIGNRNNESSALNGLGEVFLAIGRPEEARAQFAAAASLAAQIGDPGLARGRWKEALALYTAAGAAEADEISDSLLRLEAPGGSAVASET
jgi:Flp pilus assembly protein TadD